MIIVSPLHKTGQLVADRDITHVIGLLGPEMDHPVLPGIHEENRLRLSFNDISRPVDGMVCAGARDVSTLIDFVHRAGISARLLIHCWAGVSRSTAAAYIARCALYPESSEAELATRLRALSPTATPNRLMVAHADQILGRNGAMTAAIEAIGCGEYCYEGNVFEWV